MNRSKRDLLVLVKDEYMTEHAIQQEVERLNKLLYTVESYENVAVCTEFIDVHRHRILKDRTRNLARLKEKSFTPFFFLNNLN